MDVGWGMGGGTVTPLQRYIEPELLKRLSTLTVSARTVAAGVTTGGHRSPVRGSSIEFRQHRFYTPGDEPRRIDWRVLARTDRPYVREYEQETNLRCLLMLDSSGSMGYGEGGRNKLLYARRAVAAMSYVMLSQTESVGLATFGGVSQYLPPHSGETQLSRVLEMLDRTVSAGPAGVGGAFSAVANRLSRRTLVVVLSDLFSDVEVVARGLARLRHDKHEVALLRVLHRDEVEFPFSSWVRMVGMEGEGARVVEPAVARDRYLERFEYHRRKLGEACRRLSVPVYEWMTDGELGEAVTWFVFGRKGRVGR